MNYLWLPEKAGQIDTYGAFRGSFRLADSAEVEFHILGCHFFNAWLDGEYFCQGPARFESSHPEYEVIRKKLSAGEHLIAAIVHNTGISTRLLRGDIIPAFFACKIIHKDKEIAVSWKCLKLEGYESQVRRINPCLGWIEWCDTAKNPLNWHLPQYAADRWDDPVGVKAGIGTLQPLSSNPVKQFLHRLKPIAKGQFADTFAWQRDDISTAFFLRDLVCGVLPPQGIWRRYDLGKVRLGKPCFEMDLPSGASVEFAYSEILYQQRVLPYLTLSSGPSCNIDHYIARGGVQTFSPLTPKAGRFMEVHIKANPDKIKFLDEQFIERGYFDLSEAAFSCDDERLNTIWAIGVDTLRTCSEDTIIDTPYRERGQWIGDSLSVGMEIASTAFPDLSLFRRTIRQSAWSANDRGIVAGMCSGEYIYLPAYSMQWIKANLRYYELTGDRELLMEMYPFAIRNMSAFESVLGPDGLSDELGTNFIDWGYLRESSSSDMAYNLHYLIALRSMIQWCKILQRDDVDKFIALEKRVFAIIDKWLKNKLSECGGDWTRVGYHVVSLALLTNVVEPCLQVEALDYIKSHILNCFPNNAGAPRLSDPAVQLRQIITPYFAHFSLPQLIERGQMDFVLEQYRTCWGWMMDQGCTTWLEVFDVRWSHSHHWSGCPTWQLSRYVLGLSPRFDLGMNHFEFTFIPGSLGKAKGTLPIAGSDAKIHIEWIRRSEGIEYTLHADQPIYIHPKTPLPGQQMLAINAGQKHKMMLPVSMR
jgi:hypothetical protein